MLARYECINYIPTDPQPQTMKHYKIIEKTAGFLSTQNLQTELVIRTKQKDNPQFQLVQIIYVAVWRLNSSVFSEVKLYTIVSLFT